MSMSFCLFFSLFLTGDNLSDGASPFSVSPGTMAEIMQKILQWLLKLFPKRMYHFCSHFTVIKSFSHTYLQGLGYELLPCAQKRKIRFQSLVLITTNLCSLVPSLWPNTITRTQGKTLVNGELQGQCLRKSSLAALRQRPCEPSYPYEWCCSISS